MLRFIISHRLRRFTQMFDDKKVRDFQKLMCTSYAQSFYLKNLSV